MTEADDREPVGKGGTRRDARHDPAQSGDAVLNGMGHHGRRARETPRCPVPPVAPKTRNVDCPLILSACPHAVDV